MTEVEPGKYQHYSGKFYLVLSVAHHSETLEKLVVYQALYDSPEFGNKAFWVRPLAHFLDKVKINNKEIARFKKIK